jgi:hypothetical protein
MIVRVELLGQAEAVRDLLLADGWEVESGPEHSLLISHPGVPDEEAARERLDRLGLLTSPSLRIDFEPPSPTR